MTSDLIQTSAPQFAIAFTQEAEQAKDIALSTAALIARVSTAAEQEQAVVAQTELRRVINLVENARKAAKAPVLEYGRTIDTTAKHFVADLESEERRVATLVGNFQQLELSRARALEALRVKELNEIERKRQEALSTAKSHDEHDEINERANQEAAALPVVQPAKAQGQLVREDWEIEVFDVWALARAHPMCVKVEPRRSEIRQLLDAGITPAGVKAKKVVASSVRIGRERDAIVA